MREIIRSETQTQKLGVVNSQVASVRTQNEAQTAVRVIENARVGLASAVGQSDIEALTESAKASLIFDVPYPVEPESDRSHSVAHDGDHRSVDELVALTESVLGALNHEFPGFVFSHGVEQCRRAWHIQSDAGLDLHYSRDTTTLAFVAKEKGSGNIMDTFVGVECAVVDVDQVLAEFRAHLSAYGQVLAPASGRLRVVFPGLNSMAGMGLTQMIRSDLLGRVYATGASFFDGMLADGQQHFSSRLTLRDIRDADSVRVCPFDMEGVIRSPANLDIIRAGEITNLATNKRDAHRFGLAPTGTAIGDIASLPRSGFGQLAAKPTAETLSELIGDDGAVLAWFVAGGDCTRSGDIALPAQVLIALDGQGRPIGRLPACTLKGNILDVLGGGFVGATSQRVDPFSDEGFFVTHMDVVG